MPCVPGRHQYLDCDLLYLFLYIDWNLGATTDDCEAARLRHRGRGRKKLMGAVASEIVRNVSSPV
jgi:hypothetical protein